MCVHLFSASHAERLIKSAVVVAKVRTSFTTLPFMTSRRHAATVSLCTSRPQHRGYKTSIGSLLTRRRRGVPAKRTLRVVLRGQCTARGDRLRCSRDPGSNYPTGLTAPKTNRPQCRQRRRSLPQRFIRCRSATPVGNYPELEAYLATLPRLGTPIVLTAGQRGPARPYSMTFAAARVRKARKLAGLAEYVTLDACRHGGMTELGD